MEFWIDQPKILFNVNHIHEVWIYSGMTLNEKLNAMTRLIILLSLLGFIVFNRSVFLVIGLILTALIVIFHNKDLIEGMTNSNTNTMILPSNPVNNVLMSDYKENPKLKPSHPVYSDAVENSINTSALSSIMLQNKENKSIQNGFATTRDQMEFEQSMRPFFTQPVNTVDQVEYGDFINFIAGSMPSDKPLQIH